MLTKLESVVSDEFLDLAAVCEVYMNNWLEGRCTFTVGLQQNLLVLKYLTDVQHQREKAMFGSFTNYIILVGNTALKHMFCFNVPQPL